MWLRTVLSSLLVIFYQMRLPAMAASLLLPESMENTLSQRVARGAYPALIIGVIDGQRSQIVTFGRLDNGQRLDEDTQFEIGSITKTFTALMLAQLVRSGSVRLDEPVATLLDGWQVPSRDGKPITLEELATQRSGLPQLPDNFAPADRGNPYADYGPRQIEAFLSHYALTRAPGVQYEYSNVGFGLLGYALGREQHTNYAELVKERVLRPLQMNESDVVLDRASRTRLAPGHDAKGHITGNWTFDALTGAGGLRSTARDMLRYLQANMGGLPTPLYPAMTLAQQARADTSEQQRRIGLAWMTDSVGGHELIWHNGMTGGYASFIGFTSDRKRGVIVLTNTQLTGSFESFICKLSRMSPPGENVLFRSKTPEKTNFFFSHLLWRLAVPVAPPNPVSVPLDQSLSGMDIRSNSFILRRIADFKSKSEPRCNVASCS